MRFIRKVPGIALVCALFLSGQSYAQEKSYALDHIAINVRNLDTSTAFYQRYFQFDTLANPFKGLPVRWFRINENTQLHMVQGLKAPLILPPLSHFCLAIPDFDSFVGKLAMDKLTYYDGLGTPDKMTIRGDGVKQLLIKDPDGYWIEVSNRKH